MILAASSTEGCVDRALGQRISDEGLSAVSLRTESSLFNHPEEESQGLLEEKQVGMLH